MFGPVLAILIAWVLLQVVAGVLTAVLPLRILAAIVFGLAGGLTTMYGLAVSSSGVQLGQGRPVDTLLTG